MASILFVSFFGCCRPGEVLNAVPRSLILLEDAGGLQGSACFLRICKPKPGRRGMDQAISSFLSRVFAGLGENGYFYPGTIGAFRTRWNKLLLQLGIGSSAKITPGCLRAGGAVELYKRGMPIMDIFWCLSLKNTETLQRYFQEISTNIDMIDFGVPTRALIRNFKFSFRPFQLRCLL